jgi:hypothetical protein
MKLMLDIRTDWYFDVLKEMADGGSTDADDLLMEIADQVGALIRAKLDQSDD